MAGLLILPFQGATERRVRWLAASGFWLVVTLIIGSGIRGLWVIFVFALSMAALLDRWMARLIATRVLLPGAALVVLGLGAGGALDLYTARQSSDLLGASRLRETLDSHTSGFRVQDLGDGEGLLLSFHRTSPGRESILTDPIPIERRSAYLVRGRMRGMGTGEGAVGLQWLDAEGSPLRTAWTELATPGDWRELERIEAAPAAARACRLLARFSQETRGFWKLTGLELYRLGPRELGPLVSQVRYTHRRLASLVTLDLGGDASLAFRLGESGYLLGRFAQAPLAVQLFGHGLGATFSLPARTATDPPGLQPTEDLNYIHNFYVFLLYKLGVAGALLVLLAIGVWAWKLVATARRLPAGVSRGLVVALAASWIAYCIWSVTSPEILDFRIAPLWGLLLGCLPAADDDREEGAGGEERR